MIFFFFGWVSDVHKFCFSTFVVTSMLYMVVLIIINRVTREGDLLTASERKSIMYKKRLFIANLCSILLAVYFFIRHNSYCEPGGNLYTYESLTENLVMYVHLFFF